MAVRRDERGRTSSTPAHGAAIDVLRPLMRSVRPAAPGEPGALGIADVPVPRPDEGEVLVEVRAAAVNRSDALACRGILPGPFPRILGRDFAGVVTVGPPDLLGRAVWGTGGGDVGLTRDGSHAQYLVVRRDMVALLPAALSFVEAAASGLAFFTAAAALRLVGPVERDATVVVSGAVGGVGGAAVGLARRGGARVVGIVKDADEAERARACGLDDVVVAGPELARRLVAAVGAHGAAAAVDAVGGGVAPAVLSAMGVRGRVCLLSTPPQEAVTGIDLLDFYRKELCLVGLHTGRLSAVDAASILAELEPGFVDGSLRPAPVYATYALDDVARAYTDVERGVPGRPVLLPHDR